jgi:hypothetical protein
MQRHANAHCAGLFVSRKWIWDVLDTVPVAAINWIRRHEARWLFKCSPHRSKQPDQMRAFRGTARSYDPAACRMA